METIDRADFSPELAAAAEVVRRARHNAAIRGRLEMAFGMLLASVVFGAFLTVLSAGGKIEDPGWWAAIPLAIVLLSLLALNERLGLIRRLVDGGLPASAEVDNLKVIVASTALPPAGSAEIPKRRRSIWPVVLVVPLAVAFSALMWTQVDVPFIPLSGLRRSIFDFALASVFYLAVQAFLLIRTRIRKEDLPWRAPGLPIRIDPAGIRFGRFGQVPWHEVLGVELVGPEPAVQWLVRGRNPITISATTMAFKPEDAVLLTHAHLASMR